MTRFQRTMQQIQWAVIESELFTAYHNKPHPDVVILKFWSENIEMVRPAFRRKLAQMLKENTCIR